MTTHYSIESKIVWGALAMFAAATAACGGATQSVTGTAPSSLSASSGAPADGTFGLLKEGKGKGPDRTGETPTTPTLPDEDHEGDDGGYGHAALQFEGFTSDITGSCAEGLTIVINEHTIITNGDTVFQRAECTDLKPTTAAPDEAPVFHLHIAANMDAEGNLVATYVRMQGPKIGGGSEEDEHLATPQ